MEKFTKQHILDQLGQEIGGFEIPDIVKELAGYYGKPTIEFCYELLTSNNRDVIIEPPRKPKFTTKWLTGLFPHDYRNLGFGPKKRAEVMIVKKGISDEEMTNGILFSDDNAKLFKSLGNSCGIKMDEAYFTSALKFPTSGDINVWEKKIGFWFLLHEIKLVQPDYIITLGSSVVKSLIKQKLDDCRAVLRDFSFTQPIDISDAEELNEVLETEKEDADDEEEAEESEKTISSQIFPTKDPYQVFGRNMDEKPGFAKDLRTFAKIYRGVDIASEDDKRKDYREIKSSSAFDEVIKELLNLDPGTIISLDTEWGMDVDNKNWLRSLQMSWKPDQAVYFNLREATGDGDKIGKTNLDPKVFGKYLSSVFEQIQPRLLGHNLRSDRRVMKEDLGFDLITYLYHDTMLADHVIEESRKHGLTECLLRTLDVGNYEVPLNDYLAENKINAKKNGYGEIPTEVLFPYSCKDADLVRQLYFEQVKELTGSLHDLFYNLLMPSQRALAEAEDTGYLMDISKAMNLTDLLQAEQVKLEDDLVRRALRYGIADFNPRSHQQVREVLFDKLNLTPFVTTNASGEKLWEEVSHLSEEERERKNIAPSTNELTLVKLEDQHDFVKTLHVYRKVTSQVSKVFPGYEITNPTTLEFKADSGLLSYVDENGYVRPNISDIITSGRRSTREPNVQNLAGREQERLRGMLGWSEDLDIRSIFTSPPDWLFFYADLESAELYTMAHLAKDDNMLDALNNPNRDLHGEMAIKMFNLPYNPKTDGNPKEWCAEEGYQFKRDIAKVVDFGWSYGIFPKGLMKQIQSAGLDCTVEDTKLWLNQLESTFPKTRNYFEKCKKQARLQGYVETPYGRRRHSYDLTNERIQGANERSIQNFTIQSTVGDYLRQVMVNFINIRDTQNIKAKLSIDHHDAISGYIHVDYVKHLLETLLPGAFKTKVPKIGFSLGYDIEDLTISWNTDHTKEEYLQHGMREETFEEYKNVLSVKQ